MTGIVAGASNASPIVITSDGPHGFDGSETVYVYGVKGNWAANGEFAITVVDSTHFSLNGTTGNGDYISGGGIFDTDAMSACKVTQIEAQGCTPGDDGCFGQAVIWYASHGFDTGDTVHFDAVEFDGSNQIATHSFTITVVNEDKFTLDGMTNWSNGVTNPNRARARKVVT